MKKVPIAVATLVVALLAPLITVGSADAAGRTLPASIVNLSARQIANIALASARAKGTCTNVSSGASVGLSFGATTDSASNSAEQTLHFNGASGEARLVAGTAYVKMNAKFIELDFGRTAPQLANRWISLTRSDTAYHDVVTGMLLSSVLSQVLPAGTLSKSKPTTLYGVKVIAISGSANARLGLSSSKQTLFVSTTAPYLPVALDAAGRSRGVPTTLTVTFSHWGQHFHISAPSSALPISATTLAAG